jgi:signal transduction histidine kinase
LNTSDDFYNIAEYYDIEGNRISKEDMPISIVKSGKKVEGKRQKMVYLDTERYISVNGAPIYDSNGNHYLNVLSSRDITEKVRHEQLISKQKAMVESNAKMKDEFLYTMTHEFKTPITVINAAIQALEVICGGELSPKALLFIKKIKQNICRLIRLVNNLLDITRIENGYLRPCPKRIDIIHVTQIITESVAQFAEQKDIEVLFETKSEEKEFVIDEEKYERILLNLLSNAIKFTPSGKEIKVEVSFDSKNMKVSIIDQGIGIPEDKQDTIFNRFIQLDSSLSRKSEGTGIGLSLVKLLTKAMGGTITLQSIVNQGSTFTVSFPYMDIMEDTEICNGSSSDNRLVERLQIEFSDIYS